MYDVAGIMCQALPDVGAGGEERSKGVQYGPDGVVEEVADAQPRGDAHEEQAGAAAERRLQHVHGRAPGARAPPHCIPSSLELNVILWHI